MTQTTLQSLLKIGKEVEYFLANTTRKACRKPWEALPKAQYKPIRKPV